MTNDENQQNVDTEGAENVQDTEQNLDEGREQETSNEDELAQAKAEAAKYRRLFEKSQKAESSADSEESQRSEKKTTSSNDGLGFGEKAYINSLGYTDAEDHAYIEQVMQETGQDLDTVMSKKYVQAELKENAEDRKTRAATETKGDSRRTQSSSKTEVDYWIKKGEMPPKENTALRRKVIAKRRALDPMGKANKFNN